MTINRGVHPITPAAFCYPPRSSARSPAAATRARRRGAPSPRPTPPLRRPAGTAPGPNPRRRLPLGIAPLSSSPFPFPFPTYIAARRSKMVRSDACTSGDSVVGSSSSSSPLCALPNTANSASSIVPSGSISKYGHPRRPRRAQPPRREPSFPPPRPRRARRRHTRWCTRCGARRSRICEAARRCSVGRRC